MTVKLKYNYPFFVNKNNLHKIKINVNGDKIWANFGENYSFNFEK